MDLELNMKKMVNLKMKAYLNGEYLKDKSLEKYDY